MLRERMRMTVQYFLMSGTFMAKKKSILKILNPQPFSLFLSLSTSGWLGT
jgi:hypothetical protein